ncbi:laccase 2 [Lecanosticta acicola]|uniref:Laccase 2 n=1 Tax=Lecanosticta acicola TaxID=111012 RepID=A0AAI8Z8Y7_9PEZI|nr:laccase 2 [Lecanosticta acicola]
MPHLPKTLFAGQNPLIHSEAAHAYRGPPPHFHAHQTERFRVLKGAAVQKTTPGKTSCQYPPNSRKCWSYGYSIDTDYYQEHPHTGIVREYWWVIQNSTIAPDGYQQWALTVNGSIPGPAIEVDWGDEGVPGVTQCPIAPGESFTYRFTAEQYGSSWYHSHFSLQLSLGLQGPIVIHGPATADYDEDFGILLMTDWSHASLFAEWWYQRVPSGPPSLANALINGQNVFDCDTVSDPRCLGSGTRPVWHFASGKKYRFRVVNTALYSNIRFTIDGHALAVIAADFVPIVPYITDHVLVAAGQRYDVVVEANAEAGNYWLRMHWQEKCCPNDAANNTLGIIRYDSSSKELPKSANQVARLPDSCADEPPSKLVPWVVLEVGSPSSITSLNLADDPKLPQPKGFMWTLNQTYQWVNFSAPTNLLLAEHDYEFPTEALVFPKAQVSMDGPPSEESWAYFVFNDISERNRSHPMHLHGNGFRLHQLLESGLTHISQGTISSF